MAPDGSWQATIPAAGHMSFLRASPSPVDWALRRLCPGCSPQVRMEAAPGTAGHGGGTWECGPCRPSAIYSTSIPDLHIEKSMNLLALRYRNHITVKSNYQYTHMIGSLCIGDSSST